MLKISAVILSILILAPVSGTMGAEVKGEKFRVSSPAFENNGQIPKRFGCAGDNVNPLLRIENVPPGSKSLALVLDDLDAPGETYVHWILWNIDPDTKEIRENSIPEGAVQGTNDFKKNPYGGPCPPTRPHRYVFRLYALDTLLKLGPAAVKPDLEKAMKGHLLGQAELKGIYKKK